MQLNLSDTIPTDTSVAYSVQHPFYTAFSSIFSIIIAITWIYGTSYGIKQLRQLKRSS